MSVFDNFNQQNAMQAIANLTLSGNRTPEYNKAGNLNTPQAQEYAQQNGVDAVMPSSEMSPLTRMEYLNNLGRRDPNAARTDRLKVAEARASQRVGAYREEAEIQDNAALRNGVPEDVVRENRQRQDALQTLSQGERFNNYLRWKQGDPSAVEDPDLEQAINTKDHAYLAGAYGEQVAEYAFQQARQRAETAFGMTAEYGGVPQQNISWDSLADAGAGAVKGLGQAIDAIEGFGKLAYGAITSEDSAETAKSIQEGGLGKAISNFADDISPKNLQLTNQKQNNAEAIADEYGEQIYKTALKTKSEDEARREADQEREWAKFYLMTDNNNMLFSGIAEQIPNFVLGGIFAKAGAMVAKGATKAAVNAFVKQSINKAAKQAGAKATNQVLNTGAQAVAESARTQATSKLASANVNGNSAVNTVVKQQSAKQAQKQLQAQAVQKGQQVQQKFAQRATKATQNTVNQVANKAANIGGTAGAAVFNTVAEGNDVYQSTYQQGMDISNKEFAETDAGKKVLRSFGLKSFDGVKGNKEILDALTKAKEAAAAKAALKAAGKTGVTALITGGLSSGTEKVIGGVNKIAGNKASFGKQLVERGLNTVSEGAEEFVQEYTGVTYASDALNEEMGTKMFTDKGALSSGLYGAALGSASAGAMNAIPVGLKGSKEAITKAVKPLQEYTSAKANNKLDDDIVELATGAKSNAQEKGAKAIDSLKPDSNLGKFVKQVHEDIAKYPDSPFKQALQKDKSLSNQVRLFTEQANTAAKVLSNPNSKPEDINTAKQIVEQHHNYMKTLGAALEADTEASVQSKLDEIEQNRKEMEAFEKRFGDVDTDTLTEEEVNNIMAQANELGQKNIQLATELKDIKEKLYSNPLYQASQNTIKDTLESNSIEPSSTTDTDSSDDLSSLEINDLTEDTISSLSQTDSDGNNKISYKVKQLTSGLINGIKKVNSSNVSPATMRKVKTKLAKDFVNAVRKLSTNESIGTHNVKDAWKSMYGITNGLLKSLSDPNLGLEPDVKNILVNTISTVKKQARKYAKGKYPESIQLSAYGKFIGSNAGRTGIDGRTVQMRGLLDYAVEALTVGKHNDKTGKFEIGRLASINDFTHFITTQQMKLISAKALLQTTKFDQNGDVIGKPLRLENASLNNYLKDTNTVKQDGSGYVEFTDREGLKSYISILSEESGVFDKLASDIFNKKLSGKGATKTTTSPKPKQTTPKTNTDIDPSTVSVSVSNKPAKPAKTTTVTNSNSTPSTTDVNVESVGLNKAIEENTKKVEKLLEGNSKPAQGFKKISFKTSTKVFKGVEDRIEAISNINVKTFARAFLSRVNLPDDFTFSDEQWNALKQVTDFIERNGEYGNASRDITDRMFTIVGSAGTGKTTIIDYAFQYLATSATASGKPIYPIYITPTHAANLVLAMKGGAKSSEDVPLTAVKAFGNGYLNDSLKEKLKDNPEGVFVIDEASMLSRKSFEALKPIFNYLSKRLGIHPRVVFMGDASQLPEVVTKRDENGNPVTPKYIYQSSAFDIKNKVVLENSQRTNDQGILTVLNAVRHQDGDNLGQVPVLNSAKNIRYVNSTASAVDIQDGGVNTFVDTAVRAYKQNPEGTAIITYLRTRVEAYNTNMRSKLYGIKDSKKFEPQIGEYLIGYGGTQTKQPEDGNLGNSIQYKIVDKETVVTPSRSDAFAGLGITYELPKLYQRESKTTGQSFIVPLFPNENLYVEGVSENTEKLEHNRNLLASGHSKFLEKYIPTLLSNKEKAAVRTLGGYFRTLNSLVLSGQYSIIPVLNGDAYSFRVVPTASLKAENNSYQHYYRFLQHLYKTNPSFSRQVKSYVNNPNTNIRDDGAALKYLAIMLDEASNFDTFADYPYAMTIHKSQGQTLENVFADTMYLGHDTKVLDKDDNVVTSVNNSALYVAMSRTSKHLVVLNNPANSYELDPKTKIDTNKPSAIGYKDNDNREVQIDKSINTNIDPDNAINSALSPLYQEEFKFNGHTFKSIAEGYQLLKGLTKEELARFNQTGKLPDDLAGLSSTVDSDQVIDIKVGNGDQYSILSNMAASPIEVYGFPFESVEHAYQALKSGKGLTPEVMDWAENTRPLFKSGQPNRGNYRSDNKLGKANNATNVDLMKSLMVIRYKTDKAFKDTLLSTGNAKLTHSVGSDFWKQTFTDIITEIREIGKTSLPPRKPNTETETEILSELIHAALWQSPTRWNTLSGLINAGDVTYKNNTQEWYKKYAQLLNEDKANIKDSPDYHTYNKLHRDVVNKRYLAPKKPVAQTVVTDVVTDTKAKTPEPVAPSQALPVKYYSGGAFGADGMWGDIVKEATGQDIVHYVVGKKRQGNSTTGIDVNPTEDQYNEARQFTLANPVLKEIYDRNQNKSNSLQESFRQKLMLRNYMQVRDSNVVVGVARLSKDRTKVSGDTNLAVQTGVLMNKPVYVLNIGLDTQDKDSVKWFKYNYETAKFEPVIGNDTPNMNLGSMALVGSRDLELYSYTNKDGSEYTNSGKYIGALHSNLLVDAMRKVFGLKPLLKRVSGSVTPIVTTDLAKANPNTLYITMVKDESDPLSDPNLTNVATIEARQFKDDGIYASSEAQKFIDTILRYITKVYLDNPNAQDLVFDASFGQLMENTAPETYKYLVKRIKQEFRVSLNAEPTLNVKSDTRIDVSNVDWNAVTQDVKEFTREDIKTITGNKPTRLWVTEGGRKNQKNPIPLIYPNQTRMSIPAYIQWVLSSDDTNATRVRNTILSGSYRGTPFSEGYIQTIFSEGGTYPALQALNWLIYSPNSLLDTNKRLQVQESTSISVTNLKDTNHLWGDTGSTIHRALKGNDVTNTDLSQAFIKGLNVKKDTEGNLQVDSIFSLPSIKITEPANPLFKLPFEDLLAVGTDKSMDLADKYTDENLPLTDRENSVYLFHGLQTVGNIVRNYFNLGFIPMLQDRHIKAMALNGMANFLFYSKDTGEVSYTAELIPAAIKAITHSVMHHKASSKASMIRENLTANGEREFQILKITNNANVSMAKTKEKVFKGKEVKGTSLLGTEDYILQNLGTTKDEFVETLGYNVLKSMGITVDRKSDDTPVYHGLAVSIGTELLSIMQKTNLIDIKRVITYDPTVDYSENDFSTTSDDVVVSDYVSFKFNDSFEESMQLKELLESASDPNISFKEFGDRVNATIETNNLKDAMLLGISSIIKGTQSTLGKEYFPEDGSELTGVRTDAPFQVSAKDVRNKTASGYNQDLMDFAQAQNNIVWKGNGQVVEMLDENHTAMTDILRAMMGYDFGVSDNPDGDINVFRTSKRSVNAGIDRQLDIARAYLHNPTIENKEFYLKHRVISTQRTMIDADLNPQANKIHRIMLVPKMTDTETGKELEYGFTVDNSNSTNIADRALTLLNQGKPENLNTMPINEMADNEYLNVTGFGLALAQAFGIKVEKQLERESLTQLKGVLDNSLVQEAIKEIEASMNPKHEFNQQAIIDLVNSGVGDFTTPQSFNALFNLAQLNSGNGINSKGQFQPTITIEADGIANGLSNNTRQFSTSFNEQYIDSLERTGIIPLNRLYNLTREEIDALEGSGTLFTKSAGNPLRDAYVKVADALSKRVQNNINYLPNNAEYNEQDLTYIKNLKQLSLNDFISNADKFTEEAFYEDMFAKNLSSDGIEKAMEIRNGLLSLELLHRMGGLDVDNETNLFDVPVANLDLTDIVKRAVAKIATTPSVYGGQRDGITSQLSTDVRKALLADANGIYNRLKGSNSDSVEDVAQDIRILVGYLSLIGFDTATSVDDILKDKESALKWLKSFGSWTVGQRAKHRTQLGNSLGASMHKAIQDAYGEQFKIVKAVVASDGAQYTAFIFEFMNKVRTNINQRNKDKGYVSKDGSVVLDPRAYSFLSQTEVSQILKTMENSPNVATAMSKNTQFISQLHNVGNSILKDSSFSPEETKGTVSSVFNNLSMAVSASIKENWDFYSNAGASLLTSAIVSTEARTMGELVKDLLDKGIPITQVFDGAETMAFLRYLVGNKVNEITDNIHLNTSLITNFFHKLNRSNLGQHLQNARNERNFENTARLLKQYALKDSTAELATTLQVTGELLTAIQVLHSSLEMLDIMDKTSVPADMDGNVEKIIQTNQLQTYRNQINKLVQESVMQADSPDGIINLDMATHSQALEALGFYAEMILDNTADRWLGDQIKEMRILAARNQAIKEVEKKVLPYITNQFGGISNGSYRNLGGQAEQVFKEFGDYVKSTGLDPKSALQDYVTNSTTIAGRLYNKAYNKALKNLPIIANRKFKGLDKDISGAKNITEAVKQAVLDDSNLDVFDASATFMVDSFHGLLTLREEADGKPIQLTSDIDTYSKRLEKESIDDNTIEEIKANSEAIDGLYVPNAGIYVSGGNVQAAVHELTHTMLQNTIFDYYNGNIDNNAVNSSMKYIEEIALDVASRYWTDPEFLRLRQELGNKEFDVNQAYFNSGDVMVASAYNILTVFDSAFAEGKTQEEVANARADAINEFMAYGLTDLKMLGVLRYNRVNEREKKLESTGFGGIVQQYIEKLRGFFKALFNIGLMGKNKEFSTSYLNDMYLAMKVIETAGFEARKVSGLKDKFAKDKRNKRKKRASLKVNFDFNNRDFNSLNSANPAKVFGEVANRSTAVKPKHRNFLKNLFMHINNGVESHIVDYQGNKVDNYQTELDYIRNNSKHKEAQEQLLIFRNANLPMSELEENMFNLVYAAQDTMLKNNSAYADLSTGLINDVLDEIDPRDFEKVSGMPFNTLRERSLNTAGLLTLMMAHEETKEYIDSLLAKPRNKKLSKRVDDFLLARNVYKNIKGLNKNSSINDLEKLSQVLSSLDYRNKMSYVDSEAKAAYNLNKQINRIKNYNTVRKIGNAVPTDVLNRAFVDIGAIMLSGDGYYEENSILGKMVDDVVTNYLIANKDKSWVNTVLRLIRGADKSTQYIYKAQNQLSIVSDATRERIGNSANDTALSKFKSGSISEIQDKAISNILLKGTFYRLNLDNYNKGMDINVLRNKSDRYKVLRDKRDELDAVLQSVTTLNPKERQEIMNFYEWQTSGLAELLHTGKAKAVNGELSHYILPNTKAISAITSLVQLKARKPIVALTGTSTQLYQIKALIDDMVALKGIEYMDQEDVNQYIDLLTNEPEGMQYLKQSAATVERLNNTTNKNSLMGFDGYVHSKENPNKDYVVVSPKDTESLVRYMQMGYVHKATLSNGNFVMHTNVALNTAFVTGMFSLTETTINGANMYNGHRQKSNGLNERIPYIPDLEQVWNKVRKDSTFYDGLTNYSNTSPNVDGSGYITTFNTDIDRNLRNQLTETSEAGYESLGNSYARLAEERIVHNRNIKNVDLLNDAYHADPRKGQYIKLSSDVIEQGKYPEYKDFFYSLPSATREHIDSVNGVWVNKKEFDNILGYSKASMTDIFSGKSHLPKPVQKAFIKVTKAFIYDATGIHPAKAIKTVERLAKEVSGLAKDYVLNRSIIVPVQNLLSNVIHLWMAGVPVNKIPELMLQGYHEAKKFTNTQSEIIKLRQQLFIGSVTDADKTRINAKIKALETSLQRMSVKPLIDEGILTSISDLSKETVKEDDEFGLLTKASNKLGITKAKGKLPEAVKSTLMFKGSKTHNALNQLMDFGDFVAKYVLYQHLQKEGWNHNQIMAVVRDEFVNYSMNRGRVFDYLNDIGLTWFLSYKLAIQRIIFRSMRRNTLRTLAVWGAAKHIKSADIPVASDLIQTVPQQILWFDYTGYHLDATNMVDGFGSHYIWKLLDTLS